VQILQFRCDGQEEIDRGGHVGSQRDRITLREFAAAQLVVRIQRYEAEGKCG